MRRLVDSFDTPSEIDALDATWPPPGQKGPPFWEEWRGVVPDEEIEFVRVIFEDFCGAWE